MDYNPGNNLGCIKQSQINLTDPSISTLNINKKKNRADLLKLKITFGMTCLGPASR